MSFHPSRGVNHRSAARSSLALQARGMPGAALEGARFVLHGFYRISALFLSRLFSLSFDSIYRVLYCKYSFWGR